MIIRNLHRCRFRMIMSSRMSLTCSALLDEQCSLADVPDDHEQSSLIGSAEYCSRHRIVLGSIMLLIRSQHPRPCLLEDAPVALGGLLVLCVL
jgi:hypothetical protein